MGERDVYPPLPGSAFLSDDTLVSFDDDQAPVLVRDLRALRAERDRYLDLLVRVWEYGDLPGPEALAVRNALRAAAELCRRYAENPAREPGHLALVLHRLTEDPTWDLYDLVRALLESRRRLEEALERTERVLGNGGGLPEGCPDTYPERVGCALGILRAALAWPGREEGKTNA